MFLCCFNKKQCFLHIISREWITICLSTSFLCGSARHTICFMKSLALNKSVRMSKRLVECCLQKNVHSVSKSNIFSHQSKTQFTKQKLLFFVYKWWGIVSSHYFTPSQKKFIIISKIQYNTSETPLRNGKMKQKNRKINRIKIKTINIQSSRICI